MGRAYAPAQTSSSGGLSVREFEVLVHLAPETSVQECSKVFEGLQLLAEQGRIALQFERGPAGLSYPRVLRLSVRKGTRAAEVAIDLADQPDLFHAPDLEWASVYFKRSYWPDRLHRKEQAKVRPFGLNNPAIRVRTAVRVLRASAGRDLRKLATDARRLLALPRPSAFQYSPHRPAKPRVFFQTQLWDPSDNDEALVINWERTELVATLRSAFGTRFLGGLLPTAFAKAHYPELVTRLPCSMRAYPRLLSTPLIAVYSRGLHGSVAFKMSEYLAASRCIVGHRPTAVLPAPFVDGANFLAFETADQCIARCEELLSRPRDAEAMRLANSSYYRSNVEPSAHLLAVLQRSFEDA